MCLTTFAVENVIFTGTVLLEWVLTKEQLLKEVTQTIATSVLFDHVRLGSLEEERQFSCEMITDLIYHLRIVVNKSGPQLPPKRVRGRPRKKAVLNQLDDRLGGGRTTRQTKRESGSSFFALLEGPSFTLSPKKSGQKKVDQHLLPIRCFHRSEYIYRGLNFWIEAHRQPKNGGKRL